MKCLVTTLQGSVNDTSLLKLGEMRIGTTKTNPAGPITIQIISDSSIVVESVDGLKRLTTNSDGISNLVASMQISDSNMHSIYCSAGSYELSLLNRYVLRVFDCSNADGLSFDSEHFANLNELISLKLFNPSGVFNLSNLRNMPKVVDIRLRGQNVIGGFDSIFQIGEAFKVLWLYNTAVSDDVAKLKGINLTEITLYQCSGATGDIMEAVKGNALLQSLSLNTSPNLSGNLSSLIGMSNLNTLSLSGADISGDIVSLGNCLSLRNMAIGGCPKIYGSIEDMVAKYRENGRTNGTIRLLGVQSLSTITYRGQDLKSWASANIQGVADANLTWTNESITIS